jgi:hypothetical protein
MGQPPRISWLITRIKSSTTKRKRKKKSFPCTICDSSDHPSHQCPHREAARQAVSNSRSNGGRGFPSRGGNCFRGRRGGRNSPPSHYRPSNAADDERATKHLRWGFSHEFNCILAAGDSDSDDPQIPVVHTDTDDDIPDLVTESESSE